jgi:hypothetical protein
MKNVSRFKEINNNTKNDINYLEQLDDYFNNGLGTNVEKLQNFSKYVPRQNLTTFISKYEIFKKILDVPGSIIECGVSFGGGLMTFAQLSAIFEHVNYERRIIGFDTFSGFPSLSPIDKKSISKEAKKGGYSIKSFEDIQKCIEIYDSNRFLNHFPKVEIIKGDAIKTIPKYIKNNPSLVVSLLYLDFLLYEPTKIAIEKFVPKMPKGSLLVFNLIGEKNWPGPTKALLDNLNIKKLKFKKFSFDPYVHYAVIE